MGLFSRKPTVESLIKSIEKTYGKANARAYFNLESARINTTPSCPKCDNSAWGGAQKGILRIFVNPDYKGELGGHSAIDFCGKCGHIW